MVEGAGTGEESVMGSSSVRERIAIVFMTLSVVATLVLGGALAAQLGHPKQQVVQIGAASATSPDGGVSAGDQSAAAPADTGAATDTSGGAASGAGQTAGSGTSGAAGATGGATSAAGAKRAAGSATGAGQSAAGKTTATTRAGSGPAASTAAGAA